MPETSLGRIQHMRNQIAGETHPRAKVELLTRGIAQNIRDYIRMCDYTGLASYAAYLDSRTPELWTAFAWEQEQAAGAPG